MGAPLSPALGQHPQSLGPRHGDCLRTLEGHSSWVKAVALSTDGRTVVSSSDNTLQVWVLHTGDCLRTLEGHSSGVSAVALSTDG